MDLDDIFVNLDWDPSYLESIFNQDFYEMAELWNEGYVENSCLLEAIEKNEVYQPVVEDISLDDHILHRAVEKIEASMSISIHVFQSICYKLLNGLILSYQW